MTEDSSTRPKFILPLWHYMLPSHRRTKEKAYREHFLDADLRQVQAITLAGSGIVLALNLIDYPKLASQPDLLSGLILRSLLFLLGLVLVLTMRYVRKTVVVDCCSIIFTASLAAAVLSFHMLSDVAGVRIVAVIMIFIFGTHIGFPTYAFWLLIPIGLFLLGEGYLLLLTENEELLANRPAIIVITLFAEYIAITASAHQHRGRYQSFQALNRVKLLSGLLPICANCKNIRDDQGYYQQIEHYISEHSEAEFSHGICPQCVSTLYPELEPVNQGE